MFLEGINKSLFAFRQCRRYIFSFFASAVLSVVALLALQIKWLVMCIIKWITITLALHSLNSTWRTNYFCAAQLCKSASPLVILLYLMVQLSLNVYYSANHWYQHSLLLLPVQLFTTFSRANFEVKNVMKIDIKFVSFLTIERIIYLFRRFSDEFESFLVIQLFLQRSITYV